MTKICDCENAEKAYLIINPDSPNRQEILSLDPPICRDIGTSGLLVNDIEVLREKELDSDHPYRLLSGSISYEKQTTGETIEVLGAKSFRLSLDKTLKTFLMPSSCQGIVNAESYGYLLGDNYSFSYTYAGSGHGTNRWFTFVTEEDITRPFSIDYDRFFTTPNRPSSCPTRLSFYNGTFPVDFDKRAYSSHSHNYGNMPHNPLFQEYPVWEFFDEGGLLIMYEHDIIGSPASAGCELIFYYADGTTETLTYEECPNVSVLKCLEVSDQGGILTKICPYDGADPLFQCGDRQCPPETCCNPCAGSALNCCYDEQGRLIDSFVRRT
ncbi:hypothetical protein Lepto7376_3709 [[Leptolyngbya] sp. PCC 7376]|uniref:hypothetical protein n=1 Tax=[Leptolyngbya] sp. PCC 7376 TaxID=111781 RepID=UPI00029F1071|nr:hypothetical protein [[Leptolyngbya] sp. PCC 7376]AFY39885.1 hypothetical protein Lepto7376_3709 [[Leptolyngbya] sp. PCC 7376]